MSCLLASLRAIRSAAGLTRCCLSTTTYPTGVTTATDRFGGLVLDLSAVNEGTDPELVLEHVRHAVSAACTTSEAPSGGPPTAWVKLPLHLSGLATSLAVDGFRYHHAEGYYASLVKWLRPGQPSKVPKFGTHQLGVAGLLIDNDSKNNSASADPDRCRVLCVRENRRFPPASGNPLLPWKLPGGVAELGEEIPEAVVREVREETGLAARFESVLAMRHHHRHPLAFNRSDFYVLCRLSLDDEQKKLGGIKPCPDEIAQAEWLSLARLEELPQGQVAPILKAALPLLKLGLRRGFQSVEFRRFGLASVFSKRDASFYHRTVAGDELS